MEDILKIMVFGSSGNVGELVVNQALSVGYKLKVLVVLVRNVKHYQLSDNARIDVVQGDATKLEDVAKFILDAIADTKWDGDLGYY